MRRAFANRTDSTASALIAEAKAYGAKYLPINGTIDGLIWFRGNYYAVDWKSAETPLTKKQKELVEGGWALHFVRDSAQLRVVLFGA